jgi:hypothetical protein
MMGVSCAMTNLLRIAREVPGHEDLLGGHAIAEHFTPGAGLFAAGCVPHRTKFGRERLLLRLRDDIRHQLVGHGGSKQPIGLFAVIARARDHAHDDRQQRALRRLTVNG